MKLNREQPFGECYGGFAHFTQDGHFFNCNGDEVFDPDAVKADKPKRDVSPEALAKAEARKAAKAAKDAEKKKPSANDSQINAQLSGE